MIVAEAFLPGGILMANTIQASFCISQLKFSLLI